MIRDGRRRVVIEAVNPQIDRGRFPVKRTVGEKVVVQADIFADGHDVLSHPPIHPIGRINRKGKNNVPKARPEDVGSPWAIGSAEGGHKVFRTPRTFLPNTCRWEEGRPSWRA